MKRVLCHPALGTTLGAIALFVALGGPAAALDGINSVTNNDLKRGAVSNSKIRANAVTTSRVKNGNLRNRDIRPDNLPLGGIYGNRIVESSLSRVPSAANAGNAANADNATNAANADEADNAINADNADTATNANQLGGIPAARYLSGIHGVDGRSSFNSDP